MKKSKRKANRSGKCPCDICKEPQILEEHHIRGRKIPLANARSNKTYICANCHNKVHYGLIVIEGWVMTTSGAELVWHKEGEEGLTGSDAKPHVF